MIQDRIEKTSVRAHLTGLIRVLILTLVLTLPLITTASGPNGPSGGQAFFDVQKTADSGQALSFSYTIRYPGLVKVRLLDQTNTVIWRNQYVHEKAGAYQVDFRPEMLDQGNYRLEFDYKNTVLTHTVSR